MKTHYIFKDDKMRLFCFFYLFIFLLSVLKTEPRSHTSWVRVVPLSYTLAWVGFFLNCFLQIWVGSWLQNQAKSSFGNESTATSSARPSEPTRGSMAPMGEDRQAASLQTKGSRRRRRPLSLVVETCDLNFWTNVGLDCNENYGAGAWQWLF